MSDIPKNLKYAKSHEWARVEDDGTVTIGISDHAQGALGDLVFVETPAVAGTVEAGSACAVVESVKAASDVYSPIGGVVVAVNDLLDGTPELVNSDPYGKGWLFRVKPSDAGALDALLDAGIQPMCTLYHWDLPEALQQRGGFLDREIADRFADYAALIGRRLGDR